MIHPSCHRQPRPFRSARQHLLDQAGLPFQDLLPAWRIRAAVTRHGLTFRERLYGPALTVWAFVGQALSPDPSCRQAVARIAGFRAAQGLSPGSGRTDAYCRARGRLPEPALADLTRDLGQDLDRRAAPGDLLGGRPVRVVDGTVMSMPDTDANRTAYPPTRKNPESAGFPLLRMVVVFGLSAGTVLDAALGPFVGRGSGEVSLFRTIDGVLRPGDVLLGDRLYATFWDVARLTGRGVDVVMRLHAGRTPVRFRGRGHSTGNRRVWWKRPQRPRGMTPEEYERWPKWIRLRALRVDVRGTVCRSRQLVLVTSLTDARAYPAQDIAAAYKRRWDVELNLRSIKAVMGMAVLRGQTPGMVRKEIWAHLLAYNVVRGVMAEAAGRHRLPVAHISFKGTLQTLLAFAPKVEAAGSAEAARGLWEAMIGLVGQHQVGGRPGRYEPRAVRRVRRKYRRLRGSRREARRKLWGRARDPASRRPRRR